MNLADLLETDALTYANALKVTQTELKDCVSTIEELMGYLQNECVKMRKLMRKGDNQYRLIAKLVQQGEGISSASLTVQEDELNPEVEEVMESGPGA